MEVVFHNTKVAKYFHPKGPFKHEQKNLNVFMMKDDTTLHIVKFIHERVAIRRKEFIRMK